VRQGRDRHLAPSLAPRNALSAASATTFWRDALPKPALGRSPHLAPVFGGGTPRIGMCRKLSGNDGCGQELTNWYAMLKRAAIAGVGPPPQTPPQTGTPRKSSLTVAKLPPECGSVLTAGGFEPPVPANADTMPEPVLKAWPAKKVVPRRLSLTLRLGRRCWRVVPKCHCLSAIQNPDDVRDKTGCFLYAWVQGSVRWDIIGQSSVFSSAATRSCSVSTVM
jgi:hypothetical protein